MLKLDSANRRDDVEQQTGLQEKGDFRSEISDLESLIANLTATKISPEKKDDEKKKKFGFHKLRLRKNKKKQANDEQTQEEFTVRVNMLKGICKDISHRLKEDEIINANMAEEERNAVMEDCRDDDEILLFRKRINDEEERREEERNELMVAIEACENVLSKLSPTTEIETPESDLTDEDEKATEDIPEATDEIQTVESEAVEDTTSMMCCYDFKIIEIIESLMKYLLGESSEDEEQKQTEAEMTKEKVNTEEEGHVEQEEQEQEVTEVVQEEKATVGCFGCVSEMLNVGRDDDLAFDETESEFGNAVTDTVTECQTENLQMAESSAEKPKVEDSTAADTETTSPEDESTPDEGRSEKDDFASSLNCGMFSALCLEGANTEQEETEILASTEEEPQKEEEEVAVEEDEFMAEEQEVMAEEEEGATTFCCDPMALCTMQISDNNSIAAEDANETAALNSTTMNDEEKNTTRVEGISLVEAEATKSPECDVLDPLMCMAGIAAVGACVKATGDEGRRVFGSDETMRDFSPSKSFDLSTLANDTVGWHDDGTIDRGCFTSLDSLVGAKRVPDPVMSEDMFDTMEAEKKVQKKVQSVVAGAAEMFDLQVCVVPSGVDERDVKPVDTMDFIPRIEVVGMKKPEKKPSTFQKIVGFKNSSKHSRGKSSSHSREKSSHSRESKKETSNHTRSAPSTPKKASTPKKVSTPKKNKRTIDPVSTLNHVPQLEDVPVKSPKKNQKNKLSPRQDKSPKKQRVSKEKVKQGRPMSQREYRRIAAKKRRELRKKKQGRKKPLAKIEESPVVVETPNLKENNKIRRRVNKMYRDTPESLSGKPLDEMPAPIVAEILNFFSFSPPTSPRSTEGSDLIDTTTSSLTEWTDGQCVKEIKVTVKDDDEESAYDDDKNKKPWSFFNRNKQDEHGEIVECMSPVLSIPNLSTVGTRYNDDDADYIDRYYNFSDDERQRGRNERDYTGDMYDEARDDDGFVSCIRSY